MTSARTYLDYNASAPLRPEARAAMLAALDRDGNPSSVHVEGRTVRGIVEVAREEVARLVNAKPSEVVFTSGATEANTWVMAAGWPAICVSGIEHDSVLAPARAANAKLVELTASTDGIVDVRASALTDAGKGALFCLMLANNETGVIQPVAAAAALAREHGLAVHVDAVQAPGRIDVDFAALGADTLALSAHKIGGPQGVGALIRRAGLPLDPQIKGGGQERGARAGTENVVGIAGFGAAADAARHGWVEEAVRMAELRDRLEAGIRAITPQAVIFGAEVARLPNTTLFSILGMKAETAVIAFDLEGVAVSSGAACSSGKVTPSHVLAAMGVPEALAKGAIRVSLGYATSDEDVGTILKAWGKLAESLYKAGNHKEIAA